MKNKLLRKLQNKFYKTVIKPIAKKVNTATSEKIPKYEINKIHINNAKLITTREELLRILPQNGIVAELGVDEGNFSQMILSINKPKKLHLIDYWGSKRYNQIKRKKVENKFSKNIENKEVEIHLGLSTEVVESFEDNYFDWIYIDTDHSYSTTIQELYAYKDKIKDSGFIAGHDYVMGNWNKRYKYGVIEAVAEFCVKENWRFVYITADYTENPSFVITKI